VPLAGDAVASGNAAVAGTQLAVFRCPSDPGNPWIEPDAGRLQAVADGSSARGAKANYDFMAPGNYQCNCWRTMPPVARPMFGEYSTTRIEDVADGTSNTIAVAETTLDELNGAGHPWGYRNWVMIGIDLSAGINNWDWPGVDPARPRRYGQVGGWYYAGSLHPGGANFLLADGSVRFLPDTTPVSLLKLLSSMADGNAAGVLP
jgi:prepilin-type processing-associated H-X9-DG protein